MSKISNVYLQKALTICEFNFCLNYTAAGSNIHYKYWISYKHKLIIVEKKYQCNWAFLVPKIT